MLAAWTAADEQAFTDTFLALCAVAVVAFAAARFLWVRRHPFRWSRLREALVAMGVEQ